MDNAPVRNAAEQAAAEVYEIVMEAARSAAEAAVKQALAEAFGADIAGRITVEDRVTQAEAARRLNTTPQKIIRLAKKGAIRREQTDNDHVYVWLSEVRNALKTAGR